MFLLFFVKLTVVIFWFLVHLNNYIDKNLLETKILYGLRIVFVKRMKFDYRE